MILLSSIGVAIASAQDLPGKSITNEYFLKKRPNVPAQKRPRTKRYNPIRISRPAPLKTPVDHSVPTTTNIPSKYSETQIGITLWKLGPPRPKEEGVRFAVWPTPDRREMWVARRTPIDAQLREGDRIRFGIEASESGYLYFFSREIYDDGTFGPAILHFPESEETDNFIVPGIMFDFPDRIETAAYRKLESKASGYIGDLITIVVSPNLLTGLKRDGSGRLTNPELLNTIEGESMVSAFQRTDFVDSLMTQTEAEASCGPAMRGLEKETTNLKGCATRGLTKEGPSPQSIFVTKAPLGRPAAVFFRLSVR